MAEKKKTSFVTWGVLVIIVLVVYGGMNSSPSSRSSGQQVELSAGQKQAIRKDAERRAAASFESDLIFDAKKAIKGDGGINI